MFHRKLFYSPAMVILEPNTGVRGGDRAFSVFGLVSRVEDSAVVCIKKVS